jgi:hypothetical protein
VPTDAPPKRLPPWLALAEAREGPERIRRAAIGPLWVGLALVAATACGGGGAITAGDYHRQANRVCEMATRDFVDELDTVLQESLDGLGDEPTPAQLQAFYGTLVNPAQRAARIVTGMVDELRRLEPPADRAGAYASLWDDLEATIARSRSDIIEAVGDPQAATALWDNDDSPFANLELRTRELNVPNCRLDR